MWSPGKSKSKSAGSGWSRVSAIHFHSPGEVAEARWSRYLLASIIYRPAVQGSPGSERERKREPFLSVPFAKGFSISLPKRQTKEDNSFRAHDQYPIPMAALPPVPDHHLTDLETKPTNRPIGFFHRLLLLQRDARTPDWLVWPFRATIKPPHPVHLSLVPLTVERGPVQSPQPRSPGRL